MLFILCLWILSISCISYWTVSMTIHSKDTTLCSFTWMTWTCLYMHFKNTAPNTNLAKNWGYRRHNRLQNYRDQIYIKQYNLIWDLRYTVKDPSTLGTQWKLLHVSWLNAWMDFWIFASCERNQNCLKERFANCFWVLQIFMSSFLFTKRIVLNTVEALYLYICFRKKEICYFSKF